MSAATPPASSQSPAAPSPPQESQNVSQVDRAVLEYLRSRGHTAAETALLGELEVATPDDKGKAVETIDAEELVKTLAVFAHKPSRPGENILKDSSSVLQELTAMGNPSNIQSLISSIGPVGAEEILSLDPTDKQEGFRELEAWVDGSLDMYRPEFRPILFPIFCHFYLDLIQHGFKDAAHVQNDELAQRFRNEKFSVRMSRSGFGLLVGWLTEGVGGEAPGAGDGFSGEKGKRGRAAVMRVVNNHLRFDGKSSHSILLVRLVLTRTVVTSTNPSSVSSHAWEESTGLLSPLIPKASGSATASYTNPQAFNASKGDLKLGPAPLSEELRTEAERVLREQAMLERDPNGQYESYQFPRPTSMPGMIVPSESDLLPHPPTFKTVDVEREVNNVRDARKRIRLEPSALANVDVNSTQASTLRARALPSICAYTLHDVAEGSPCCTFSQDTSLMAAGFAESYIRLWSLKGEKLQGMRSDFNANSVKDVSSLHKIKEKKGSTTRKLIGHSGPVYSVAFDPIGGSATPPKYLLSASADATARLCVSNFIPTLFTWQQDQVTGRHGTVSTLALSPDGRYLASAGEDLAINLWDIGSGKRIKKMTGHSASIYSLAFSAESSLLVSGGADCTVRCWDVKGAGGCKGKPRDNGTMGLANGDTGSHSYGDDENPETTDLMATFPTKRTPITNVQFTPRNLCMVGGSSSELR
ncbi:hypothetical protein C0991_000241 [Blastosporella zonata]|nr:hypothetical protein C0991_000241 [Blastosporella zonata]